MGVFLFSFFGRWQILVLPDAGSQKGRWGLVEGKGERGKFVFSLFVFSLLFELDPSLFFGRISFLFSGGVCVVYGVSFVGTVLCLC